MVREVLQGQAGRRAPAYLDVGVQLEHASAVGAHDLPWSDREQVPAAAAATLRRPPAGHWAVACGGAGARPSA